MLSNIFRLIKIIKKKNVINKLRMKLKMLNPVIRSLKKLKTPEITNKIQIIALIKVNFLNDKSSRFEILLKYVLVFCSKKMVITFKQLLFDINF